MAQYLISLQAANNQTGKGGLVGCLDASAAKVVDSTGSDADQARAWAVGLENAVD